MKVIDIEDDTKPRRGRKSTVYDAVAGRVNSLGFIYPDSLIPGTRDRPSKSVDPVPPEEVLFKRSRAPDRFHEDDVYFQDRHLLTGLPESDLVKAIHSYASDVHGTLNIEASRRGRFDAKAIFGSLDETALLCMGILIEELATSEMSDNYTFAVFVERQSKALRFRRKWAARNRKHVNHHSPKRKAERQHIDHEESGSSKHVAVADKVINNATRETSTPQDEQT